MSDNLSDLIIVRAIEFHRMLRQKMWCAKPGEKDLNFHQLHAAIVIMEHQGVTMKEFAGSLRITSPSATSLVNRLVKMGWVQRFADKDNRKLVRLRIAPRGQKALQTRLRRKKQEMRKIVSFLAPADQKDFARILLHLTKALEQSPLQ